MQLILIAHGSRDARWRGSLALLTDQVRRQVTGEPSLQDVKVAYMQFEGPTLPEVVEDGLASGETEFQLLPLFMASAGHVEKDIVPMVEELSAAHSQARLNLLPPVGEDPLFPEFLAKVLARGPT